MRTHTYKQTHTHTYKQTNTHTQTVTHLSRALCICGLLMKIWFKSAINKPRMRFPTLHKTGLKSNWRCFQLSLHTHSFSYSGHERKYIILKYACSKLMYDWLACFGLLYFVLFFWLGMSPLGVGPLLLNLYVQTQNCPQK